MSEQSDAIVMSIEKMADVATHATFKAVEMRLLANLNHPDTPKTMIDGLYRALDIVRAMNGLPPYRADDE